MKQLNHIKKSFPFTNHPKFQLVTNTKGGDKTQIIKGNNKVIHARLNDAEFLYKQDRKHPLDSHIYTNKLKKMVFHKGLQSVCTLYDKTNRIIHISNWISEKTKLNKEKMYIAAKLCKASLATNVVFEFPELQDWMGYYYTYQTYGDEIARAIRDYYGTAEKPNTLAQALSIADNIDTLVGLFGINEQPTGSKDPLALRRAMFAIVRICIENALDLSLSDLIDQALQQFDTITLPNQNTKEELLKFLNDRVESYYLKNDYSIHSIRAITHSHNDNSNLYQLNQRLQALQNSHNTEAIQILAQMNKRVKNLLKKNPIETTQPVALKLQEPAEQQLQQALSKIKGNVNATLTQNDYHNTLEHLTQLAEPLAQFFDQVMVLVEDPALRHNRLSLLGKAQQLLLKVADFSYLNDDSCI